MCNNPTSQGLYSWPLHLKFVSDILLVSPLIGLVTLTFDLLTLNLVRVIAREVGNLLNSFYVLGFLFSTNGPSQQLSDGTRDLATLQP